VVWVCLTTAPGGDAGRLAYNHQRLRQRIEAVYGYRGLEHFTVQTSEGNGVLHIFWAWRPPPGWRGRDFYVPQGWLSREWARIHGAPIVWICRVRMGRRSLRRVGAYAVAQYVADQRGYVRMSWSWKRSLGFPLAGCWEVLKRWWGHTGKLELVRLWERFLSGLAVPFMPGGVPWDMAGVRLLYWRWRGRVWRMASVWAAPWSV
jgi:hypothetical protein